MTHRRTAFFTALLFFQCLLASSELHDLVQNITEASIRDYYYRSADPLWDPLRFHQGETREEGTGGHDFVKAYLQEQLAGYLGEDQVYVHEFSWAEGTNGKGYNIIGIKPGRLGDSSDVWIVGAHYDSYDMDRTGTAPGANDNGSGMSGLLEMVRVINTRESDATIIFAFWDAEEPHYSTHSWESGSSFGSDVYSGPSGSRAWVNDHFTESVDHEEPQIILWNKVAGYINLDMFGYPGIDNTVWIYHGGSNWNDQIGDQSIYYPTNDQVNELYLSAQYYLSNYGYDDQDPANYLTVIGKGTMAYSDNASFSRAGIASLEYAESDWNSDPHYHQSSDYYRPFGGDVYYADENPQIDFMTMVVRGALALLADTTGLNLSSDIPTPVELLDFQAIPNENCVCLDWCTASETENLGFLLERRKNGDISWDIISSYLSNNALMGAGCTTEIMSYSYRDTSVVPGNRYEYRLSDIDLRGERNILKTTSLKFPGIRYKSNSQLFPNPFNPTVMIRYDIYEEADVEIKVFDLNGRHIETLINQTQSIGSFELTWNAGNMPSGIYLVQISLNHADQSRSTQVLKAILKK